MESLSTTEFLTINALYHEESLDIPMQGSLKHLAEMGIVEHIGRSRYVLARSLYSAAGKTGVHTRIVGLDRDTNKELLLKHMRENGEKGAPLKELQQVLPGHNRGQIQVLLRELRKENRAYCLGKTHAAKWFAGAMPEDNWLQPIATTLQLSCNVVAKDSDQVVRHLKNAEDVLKQYFGHSTFRKGQKELIDALLSGRDVLAVMPTGAGKSVCYQVPALMLPGMTLVISPLISLMKDQVAALTQAGIPATYLNSSMNTEEYMYTLEDARQGAYKILYVAPERLTAGAFIGLCRQVKISLVAIDEAHCVSQWGQDFRPSYLKIAAFIASLAQRPTVGAFTATATEQVKADIKKLLELRKPLEVTTGFDRPNLYFDVMEAENKNSYLKSFLTEHRGQSGIIYCATRKGVEAVCEHLVKDGFSAVRYHAGLTDEERRGNQELFVYDQAQVMVATNAFGMGIDKSNVSFVIHYNMPQSLESYYQEAGRAGRDGSPAACILLFSNADIHTAKYLILHAEENDELTPEERAAVQQTDLKRLNRMIDYSKTTDCLRKNILSYFGEEAPSACGNCGNCKREIIRQDMTLEAQKILSAVTRVERRYPYGLGVTLIVRMLHGSKEQRILDLGLNEFSTYGIMHDTDRKIIRNYIEHLIQEGYLTLSEEYPVLHTTEKARAVLYNGKKVFIYQRRDKAPVRKKAEKQTETHSDLFDYLRTVRLELAKQEKVPAYIILSNAALSDMAQKLPHTRQELLNVSGIGEVKAQRYGDMFLQAIQSWENNERKS